MHVRVASEITRIWLDSKLHTRSTPFWLLPHVRAYGNFSDTCSDLWGSDKDEGPDGQSSMPSVEQARVP